MRPQTNTLNASVANYSIGFIMLIVGALLAMLISTGDSTIGLIAISIPLVFGFVILGFLNSYFCLFAF